MRKTLFVWALLCFAFTLPAIGQHKGHHDHDHEEDLRCGTMAADQELRNKYPNLGSLDDFERWLAPLVEEYKNRPNKANVVVTLPIVFHVVHRGETEGSGTNVSQALINAQIDQLNNDFRRILGTSGYSSDSRAADTEIEFCAATIDPSGNAMAQAGINRINGANQGWPSAPNRSYYESTIKPQTYWNPDEYINIWVSNLQGGLLGYAQFPSQSGLGGLSNNEGGATTDGVVILYSSVGSTTNPFPNAAPYNEGRTLTHELGHFFGLRHIWGDATCGNDYCNDTPEASNSASGCPTKTTCDGNLDMVENYMDYSYDACMNIFTNDQKTRIQTVMNNSPRRGVLANSTKCGNGGGGPQCSVTISNFPYSESFESGFGDWSQVSGDNFDWSRNSGGTPSNNTGPSSASAGTWYVYMESSSPNYSNRRAILAGPCFDLSSASAASFTFDYHMYGAAAMGSLALEISTDNGSSWSKIWERLSNQGNTWTSETVNLDAYTGGTIQLRFNGITGTTWQGDMAVDNISLSTSGGGGGNGCSSGLTSYPYNEGWESSFGDWTQDSGDDFNWSRNSGTTPSSNTGPSSAFAGSFYAYMESSSPNYSNKRAILNSPCFDLTSANTASFSFYYHMYGASAMGSLALELSDDGGSSWTKVWERTGNQGNSWQAATVDLDNYVGSGVQLRFNGITGTTWQGDMAIDALSLTTSGGGGGCATVTITLTFDNYPEETSWEITDGGGNVVESGGTYGSQADGSTLVVNECIAGGCYNFTILDAYGDGMCCSYGNGSYLVTNGAGQTLASGASFSSSETTAFCVSTSSRTVAAPAGETALDASQLTLFPNPVNDLLTVYYDSEFAAEVEVRIVDLMGRIIKRNRVSLSRGMNTYEVPVNEISAGTYMLMMTSDKDVIAKRFVVSK